MSVTIRVNGLASLHSALAALPQTMTAGVKITGESAAYGLVWEWGYANRVINPGPKTQWGTNPDGEQKVLTIVAPSGYIRVNRDKYVAILKEEFKAAGLTSKPISDWEGIMTSMFNKAAERCAEVISDAAPVDSGQLRSEIKAAPVGDSALADEKHTGLAIGMEWAG